MKHDPGMFVLQLLNDVSDAIIASDTRHVIREWNPAAEKLYGYSKAEVLGRMIADVTHRKYPGTTRSTVLEKFARDGFWEGDVQEQRKDGELILVHTRVSKVHSITGEFIGLVAINRDITHQKLMEDELIQKTKLEFMGFLIGSVGHSLNNHLTAILGSISVSRHYAMGNDKVQSYLARAEHACIAIRNTMSQLLLMSGEILPFFDLVHLQAVIEKAIESYSTHPDLHFHLSLDPAIPPVWGNFKHLLLVFRNLFDNAAEAMENRGDISIDAGIDDIVFSRNEPRSSGITIRVTDTGPGIQPDLQAKVFDPFFSTRSQSRGLGLSVSRSIIRQHGGSIMAATAAGGGTEMIISIPTANSNRRDPLVKKTVRILVWEPEDLLCQVSCDLVRELGHEAMGVKNGRECINEIRKNHDNGQPFDLVIITIDLTTTDLIKSTMDSMKNIQPDLQAIAIADQPEQSCRIEFVAHGFSGGLTRPIKLESLHAEINRVLEISAPPICSPNDIC